MAKPNLHPPSHKIVISCTTCKSLYPTHSATPNSLSVEICANCHPFYTGQQRLVDTEGRVDRFNKKFSREAMAERAKARKID